MPPKTEILIATAYGDINLGNNLTIPSTVDTVSPTAEVTNFTPDGFLYIIKNWKQLVYQQWDGHINHALIR